MTLLKVKGAISAKDLVKAKQVIYSPNFVEFQYLCRDYYLGWS